jgi:uncharacterized protein (UPF0332 family)
MTPEDLEYIHLRLAGAEETLDEARILLECDRLRGAVNRIYYACFYSVCALLLLEGLSSSKHSGVRSLFVRGWIKPGILPKEMGKFYQQIFERRLIGDYRGVATFSPGEVRAWLGEAIAFVARVREEVTKRL